MRHYKNNHKRSRFRSNGDRNFHRNGNEKINTDFSNVSNFKRQIHSRNNLNLSKLIEKYTNFAREALSNGDKIQSENYLQHADHFTRLQAAKENIKKSETSNITPNNIYSKPENSEESSEKINQKENNPES